MALLKIRSVGEVKTASDNRKYFTLKLSAGLGQAEHTRNIFEDFIRDSETGLPTEQKVWKRGTYAEFKAAMEAGEKVEGSIVTAKVAPYKIRDNDVNTATYIVFADEKAESVFASNNHPILDEQTGELLGVKKSAKAILATDEAKEEMKEEVKA